MRSVAFQSILRKRIRKLPKFLNFLKIIIQFYSILFNRVLSPARRLPRRFGESCSLVERTADSGGVSAAVKAAVAEVEKEIKVVEAEIKKKERWETRTTVKKAVVRGMDTGGTAARRAR